MSMPTNAGKCESCFPFESSHVRDYVQNLQKSTKSPRQADFFVQLFIRSILVKDEDLNNFQVSQTCANDA